MATKKEFIEQNNGKLFKRIITKGATIEDMPAMLAGLKAMAAARGFTVKNHDNNWSFERDGVPTGQKFFKPVLQREKLSIMQFKSNRTVFDGIVGELPLASEIDRDSFTKDYGSVVYRYELVKEEA